MSTMKEVCEQVGISYETLRFYCNEGLVPHVQRDKNNYRVFDTRNIEWLKGLCCLRQSGMSIDEMRNYMNLCIQGKPTIPERKRLLAKQRALLLTRIDELQKSVDFIDNKQGYYDAVMDGRIAYTSNLISTDE